MIRLVIAFSIIVSLVFFATVCTAQFDPLGVTEPIDLEFKDCAAILVGGKVLVKDYSPDAKCKLSYKQMESTLTVSEVGFSEDVIFPTGKPLAFMVAVRHQKTGTVWMYSHQPQTEVQLDLILQECKDGDELIIMTVDKRIALPHHVIKMDLGC